jgi:hypothetical protein
MDDETKGVLQNLAKTHDNLATHVVALTAIIGALLEENKKIKEDRVAYWCQATSRGQQGINPAQVEAIARGILRGPQKASPVPSDKK